VEFGFNGMIVTRVKLLRLLVAGCVQDAELANAKLLAEKQTSELMQQKEEISELRSQLDGSSSADGDLVRQRDVLLQRITVSRLVLQCYFCIIVLHAYQ